MLGGRVEGGKMTGGIVGVVDGEGNEVEGWFGDVDFIGARLYTCNEFDVSL
jgi:hypothetical protein